MTRRLLAIAVVAAGCASAPTRVRDLDGNPVPLYSVAAHGPVQKVRCSDGREYLVLTDPPPPFLRGASLGSVLRRGQSIDDVCGRIEAIRQ